MAVGAIPLLAASRLARPGVSVIDERERDQSYWMATIPKLPRFSSLPHDVEVDVAVVGGGFTGLATAYYLKKLDPSRRVALLESHRFGSGASSRNSGAVSARFRGHDPSDTSVAGYELLKRFAADEGIDVELVENVPAIYLHHRTPPGKADLAGEELAGQIGSDFYVAADVTSTNALHPGKLIAGLIAANARLGVELYEGTPVAQIERRERPITLYTTRGRVRARDVALATNAYTPRLGVAADRIMALHHRVLVTRPLTPEEGEHSGLERWPLRFEVGGYATHTVRTTPDRRFFFRHVLGHRAFERTDWAIDARAKELGRRALHHRYPWLDGVAVEYEWHGVTARTRDWWPVSGQVDDHLYIAAGYNGSGVMPTHYFGYLLANHILGLEGAQLALLKPPGTHPRLPGELLRHLAVQGWFRYRGLRDG
jgi:glycine/D-amino acid oxidase-like deaminating enzyme